MQEDYTLLAFAAEGRGEKSRPGGGAEQLAQLGTAEERGTAGTKKNGRMA